jgi:hypothetical protein
MRYSLENEIIETRKSLQDVIGALEYIRTIENSIGIAEAQKKDFGMLKKILESPEKF